MKLQMQRRSRGEMRDSVALKQEIVVRAKLLKMVIAKVNGKLFRFWSQFQAEIDKNATISNMTRF